MSAILLAIERLEMYFDPLENYCQQNKETIARELEEEYDILSSITEDKSESYHAAYSITK